MKQKLIILSDYGLDDAVASEYLLKNAHLFDGIDILAVGGNVPLSVAFINAKKLLAHTEGDLTNVHLVDTSVLPQPECYLADIHGADGMGNVLKDAPCPVEILSFNTWIDTVTKNSLLLSLGPCTVTAEILRRVGSLPLVIMAGNVSEVPNYMGREFNHALDIASFSYCTKFPHTVATLDSCRKPCFNFAKMEILESGLLQKYILRSVQLATLRHEDRCYIYDYIAAKYLVEPEKFEILQQVDPDGNTLSVLYPI